MVIFAAFPSYRPAEYLKYVGGGEISNRILLEGLVKRGHSVTVLTLNTSGFGSGYYNGVLVKDFGFKKRSVLNRFIAATRFKMLTLKYTQSKKKPDVILCGTSCLGIALNLGDKLRSPVGLFVRAYENFDMPLKFTEKIIFKIRNFLLGDCGPSSVEKVDFLLPNSRFMKKYCFENLRFKIPSKIVYPPIVFESAMPFVNNRIKTISVIGSSNKKGFEIVRSLSKNFPDINFRVVGAKPKKNILDNNLKITFTGWLDVYYEFSNNTDVVIVPSVWMEPFGRVAVEALVCGKPVLVSNIGGLPEAVSHQNILTVKSGDVHAWTDALSRLINNSNDFISAAKIASYNVKKFSCDCQIGILDKALRFYAYKYHFNSDVK